MGNKLHVNNVTCELVLHLHIFQCHCIATSVIIVDQFAHFLSSFLYL